MIEKVQEFQNNSILKIIDPKIGFPEIDLKKGSSIGIYSNNVNLITKNFFKILCEPQKYAEKVSINEIIANNSSWIGRAFTHIVIPSLWNESILSILMNKPIKRHLILIAATAEEVIYEELAEISKLTTLFKTEGAIITISNSKDLLEATSEIFVDDNGNEIDSEFADVFEDITTQEKVLIDDLKCNFSDLRYKKIMIKNKNIYM